MSCQNFFNVNFIRINLIAIFFYYSFNVLLPNAAFCLFPQFFADADLICLLINCAISNTPLFFLLFWALFPELIYLITHMPNQQFIENHLLVQCGKRTNVFQLKHFVFALSHIIICIRIILFFYEFLHVNHFNSVFFIVLAVLDFLKFK